MKTNKLFLATKWGLLIFTLCLVLPVNAQRKKNFTFEIGISHPVNLGETSVEAGEQFGGHVQFSHMLKNSQFSIDWALSYTQYNETERHNWSTDKEKTWALSLIPSINLHFHQSKMYDAYAGIGIGGSINAISDGDCCALPGSSCSDSRDPEKITILPRVGVLIANHLNVGFEYHIVGEYLNRGSLTIGYVF